MDQTIDRGGSAPAFTAALSRRAALAAAVAAMAGVPAIAAPAPGVTPAARAAAAGGSIAALGKTIAGLWDEHHRLDLACLGLHGAAQEACETEKEGILDLGWEMSLGALRMRARTLADGAVQAALLGEMVENLTSSGIFDHANPAEAAELRACVSGAASLVLLLAGAAGVSVAELGPSAVAASLDRAFPGAVAVGA
jgi:hypothetical protein